MGGVSRGAVPDNGNSLARQCLAAINVVALSSTRRSALGTGGNIILCTGVVKKGSA